VAIDAKTGIPVRHEFVFGHGAYLTTAVEPVLEYVDGKVTGRQVVDEASGEPKWSVTVLDADPVVRGSAKSVKVTLIARVQPVPPAAPDGAFPFPLVEFEGLAVKPYPAEVMNGRFKVAYSMTARGFANA
jgi:hypothetical protein